jgi:hypothetical protein
MMNRIFRGIQEFTGGILSLLRTTKPLQSRRTAIPAILVLGVWLAAVVFTETRHEFWRDEVRALSLARAADSPLALYQTVQYDGHPLVWYLILYIGKSIVNTPLVLPIASMGIGFAAVAIFLLFAPMPLWFKGMFIFSAFPFYEYSVMARNYGITMLLLFVIAWVYRNRDRRGWLLALLIALLANTNAHSLIFAGLITAMWAWDVMTGRRAELTIRKVLSLGFFLLIIVGGMGFSILCCMPRENTILTDVRDTLSWNTLFAAVWQSALHPEISFYQIMPDWVPSWMVAILFFLAILGLIKSPVLFLSALLSEIGLGVIFRLVYVGYYRHQGLFLIFVVFLYWIFLEFRRREKTLDICEGFFRIGFFLALPLILFSGILQMRGTAWRDIRMELSSSKALGEFLNSNPVYRNAILLPEPDYIIESVAYYADNDIYLPREKRFSKTVSWTTDSAPTLSLEELMAAARDLNHRYQKPVMIILGHFDLDLSKPGEKQYSYNKIFTWDANSSEDFRKNTEFLAEFKNSLDEDEKYQVYALRDVSAGLKESLQAIAYPYAYRGELAWTAPWCFLMPKCAPFPSNA